jgi:hypothetical protein
MSRQITYNSDNDRAYRTIRLCVSNDVLLAALEELEKDTGNDPDEIAREALISHLEERGAIELQ